jgi:hypothetical protein
MLGIAPLGLLLSLLLSASLGANERPCQEPLQKPPLTALIRAAWSTRDFHNSKIRNIEEARRVLAKLSPVGLVSALGAVENQVVKMKRIGDSVRSSDLTRPEKQAGRLGDFLRYVQIKTLAKLNSRSMLLSLMGEIFPRIPLIGARFEDLLLRDSLINGFVNLVRIVAQVKPSAHKAEYDKALAPGTVEEKRLALEGMQALFSNPRLYALMPFDVRQGLLQMALVFASQHASLSTPARDVLLRAQRQNEPQVIDVETVGNSPSTTSNGGLSESNG